MSPFKSFTNFFSWINSFKIKSKLIILFILLKVIPIAIIAFIAFYGAISLEKKLIPNIEKIYKQHHNTFKIASSEFIKENITSLDSAYQNNIENQGVEIGKQIANFLYQRDQDIILLTTLPIAYSTFKNFATVNTSPLRIPAKYSYDKKYGIWKSLNKEVIKPVSISVPLPQTSKYYSCKHSSKIQNKQVPIYKEISFINLSGREEIKYSTLSKDLKNIKYRRNTYIKAERYFDKIQSLKKGEIYVSDVIGAYVKAQIRGKYNIKNTNEIGIKFNPEKSAFAGIENPVGKRYKAIIRFITPYYKNGIKIGYISLALDFRHVQEFTDYASPVQGEIRDIPNSESANYCYLWGPEGLLIAHPKNYYISGFNPQTGKRVAPWMHQQLYDEWKSSGESDAYTFLKSVPQWYKPEDFQASSKEQQLDSGQMALDIRYSREPMWTGYGLFQITKDGGFGSYQYFWDGKWKLMTASPIPYFTGKYGNSPRGFGIVCLGADVNEFHKSASKMEIQINNLVKKEGEILQSNLKENKKILHKFSISTIKNLSFASVIMIFIVILIAIWLSNLLTSKLKNLTIGAQEFGKENFNFRIPVNTHDEIGSLEKAFNNMARELHLINKKQKKYEKQIIEKNSDLKNISYFLNQLKEHSPDALFVHQPSGQITEVNQTTEKLFGYSKDQIRNLSIQDLSSSKHNQEEALAKINETMLKGCVDFEWELKNKAGLIVPATVRLRKINIKNKEFVLSFVTDIRKRKKAEQDVRKAHKQLSDIIEFLPDATFVINKEKIVIAWNKALENMTQILKSKIIGKGNFEYSIPFYGERRPILIDLIGNDDPLLKSKYQNVTQQGQYIMGEVYVPSLYGGNGATVRVTASPLIDENGKIYGAIESVRDISHVKKAELELKLSEEKYKAIFNDSVLGIFQSTLDGQLINANIAFAKMIGFSDVNEAIRKCNTKEFYLEPERRTIIIKKLLEEGKIITYAEKFINRSGKVWIGNINVRFVKNANNKSNYIEGFVEDVTELKKYEQKLIEAKLKAEESDRLKSSFLANMSHEIRTPLNSIIGFSDLINQKEMEESKRNKFINIIHKNGKQLLRIISDILDVSKIEVGQLVITKSEFLVKEFMQDIYTNFSEQIEEEQKSHLKFILDFKEELNNIKIITDQGRLQQILLNLLDNALKFTEKGCITLGCKKTKHSEILFFVKDTGVGIPLEDQNKIFKRFIQVEDASTQFLSGTGLGLAISKELTKLLNGKIWLNSIPQKGSTFYISIPSK